MALPRSARELQDLFNATLSLMMDRVFPPGVLYPEAVMRLAGLAPPELPVASQEAMGPNPKIAAEKLLRSVLPEELCVSLSAINECEVQGKKYRYKLFKNSKTHCFQGDKVFSCCIQLEDAKAPDTDRIVAEYLLIRNDEAQYLATANLTQIQGPRGRAYGQLSGAAVRGIAGFRGLEINNLLLTTDTVLRMFLQLIMEREQMRGRRFRLIREAEAHYGTPNMLNMYRIHVPIEYSDLDLTLSAGEFAHRFLRTSADQFTRLLFEPGFVITAFFQLSTPNIGGTIRDDDSGVAVRLSRAYDIRDGSRPTYFEAAVIREQI